MYHAGNAERDGFGHLALACEDVYACSEQLEAAGIPFKKRPDEGRMKVRESPVKCASSGVRGWSLLRTGVDCLHRALAHA